MHPQSINVNPTQLQQILQLQQLQRQQAQFQQQQQQNNRQQIQIFASPPNTNHVNNNNNTPNTANTATLFQVNGNNLSNNEDNQANNNNGHNNNNNPTNGIQFQPLQILQMAQGNNNNPNNNPNNQNNNAVNNNNNRSNNTPISFTTSIPNFNANRIALIHQLRQRQQQAQQQQNITQQGLAAAMGQAQHVNHAQVQAGPGVTNANGGNGNGNGNTGGQFRQSIQQQMVTFIQQLQQFPPLFQHLQNNPHVLAQLLQQFKWKQEQNARDMQQRLNMANNIQVPISAANVANVGGLIRSFAAQRQLQHNNQNNMLNVAHPPISIQPPNTNNNTGLLPALENEHSKSLDNQQNNHNNHHNNHIHNQNKSADDVIILNDTDVNLNLNEDNNVNSANANNSNSSNISIPPLLNATNASGGGTGTSISQLDFSQLKTMRIPMMIEGDDNNTQNTQQSIPIQTQLQTQASPLKRPFSSMVKVADKIAESPPMKRRRLNNEKATITISSDDTSLKERDREKKKKKRRKREKKKDKDKERSGYTTRSSSKKKEREEIVSLLSDGGDREYKSEYKSFGDMLNDDLGDGDGDGDGGDVILGDDFMNDPLISEIAKKMYEIRQISATQRMATPERSGNINAGLDVLLQAIDEMDQQKIRVSKRKNGELFIVSEEGKTENNNIDKIREILGLNYSFFKLNTASTIIKSIATSNDVSFKNKLSVLCGEFSENYDAGLLQVFKTCTDKKFQNKFISCGKSGDVISYFSNWDIIIKMNLMAAMEHWLRNYRIKEVVGLIFALMDHLFSYKLYQYLCNISETNNMSNNNNNQLQENNNNKLESEEWICTTGNILFSSIENDAKKLREIETTHLDWLFPYWKSVLLQAQEPVKCLCRSYLINSAPNPWKMRLYAMIKQTPHCPKNTLLSSNRKVNKKSKSMSPHHSNNNESKVHVDENKKSKTPPHNHFIRTKTSQSMSINAIQKNNKNKNKNKNNIPSSSVCGKTFMNALECAEHSKQCKECKHRIVSISSDV